MHPERFLLLPSYTPAGLSNQRMELEIRAGLALLTARTLVLPDRFKLYHGESKPDANEPELLDLFDLPIPHLRLRDFTARHAGITATPLPWTGQGQADAAYFVSAAMRPMLDADHEHQFAGGRSLCWEVPAHLSAEPCLAAPVRTLSWYSRFFLAAPDEMARLRQLMRQVAPRLEYRQYADELSKSLGEYNAVHIRRGDFLRWWVKVPSAGEVLEQLEQVCPTGEPLLICTDEPGSEYFTAIRARYPNARFVDDVLDQDARFAGLSWSGPLLKALLTQMLAARARRFAGTFYSTFTGYIHRERMVEFGHRDAHFLSNPFPEMPFAGGQFLERRTGRYSWNRLAYPCQAEVLAWCREWPEAAGPSWTLAESSASSAALRNDRLPAEDLFASVTADGPPPCVAASNWPAVANLAAEWNVGSLLLGRLRDVEIGAEPRRRLAEHHRIAFARSALVARRGAELCRHLNQNGVPAVVFKGLAAMVQLYNGPAERTIKDVDLLVCEQDVTRAVDQLSALGLKPEDGGDWDRYREFVKDLPGMAGNQSLALYGARHGDVDLHWRFGSNPVDELRPERILERSIERVFQGVTVRVVSPADGLVLAAHHSLREHFAPDEMLRDLVDARRWFALLSQTGQLPAALDLAAQCGLSAAVQAYAALLDLDIGGLGHTSDSDDLASLFLLQLREGSIHRDLASLADPAAWRKVARGALRGWKQYRATMAGFEVKAEGRAVPLAARATALAKQVAGFPMERWRALRTVARLKSAYQDRRA